MRTVAVLPVKRFARAKQRLRGAIDAPAREALAEAMTGDVLDVLAGLAELDEVFVVTAEQRAARLAAAVGFTVVDDRAEAGQSAAALRGLAAASAADADRVVLLPGDTPALDRADLLALLARREAVVVVADRHGTGTNALVLTPPEAIVPAFGPGSRARHEALAEAAGLDHAVVDAPSLRLDVDTPEDLAALRASGRLGGRTAAALAVP